LPVIGLTAYVSREERDKSLACGMNEQLVKPVMPDELVATIQRFMTKDQPAAPSDKVVC
jgi:CheY-like chemotaxis protein